MRMLAHMSGTSWNELRDWAPDQADHASLIAALDDAYMRRVGASGEQYLFGVTADDLRLLIAEAPWRIRDIRESIRQGEMSAVYRSAATALERDVRRWRALIDRSV